ncbi:MAG: DUF3570 domain-containing protein [Gammaproteobacteria bacterium]|nr:DUF3570 domain-containing protein [Gammaproteobacteria bacterium]
MSGGLTLSKNFSRGIRFNAGFEYYTHQGALKLGGGGATDYADFAYWLAHSACLICGWIQSFRRHRDVPP